MAVLIIPSEMSFCPRQLPESPADLLFCWLSQLTRFWSSMSCWAEHPLWLADPRQLFKVWSCAACIGYPASSCCIRCCTVRPLPSFVMIPTLVSSIFCISLSSKYLAASLLRPPLISVPKKNGGLMGLRYIFLRTVALVLQALPAATPNYLLQCSLTCETWSICRRFLSSILDFLIFFPLAASKLAVII